MFVVPDHESDSEGSEVDVNHVMLREKWLTKNDRLLILENVGMNDYLRGGRRRAQGRRRVDPAGDSDASDVVVQGPARVEGDWTPLVGLSEVGERPATSHAVRRVECGDDLPSLPGWSSRGGLTPGHVSRASAGEGRFDGFDQRRAGLGQADQCQPNQCLPQVSMPLLHARGCVLRRRERL